jgi:hypothetical protein
MKIFKHPSAAAAAGPRGEKPGKGGPAGEEPFSGILKAASGRENHGGIKMKSKTKVAIAIILALVLLAGMLAGCGLQKNQAYQAAKQLLCNPTDEEKTDAALAVATVDAALSFFAAVVTTPAIGDLVAKLEAAQNIFSFVQRGICVTLDQLEGALGAVDEAATEQAKMLGTKESLKKPFQSLRLWVASRK